jgi:hypothetical protein
MNTVVVQVICEVVGRASSKCTKHVNGSLLYLNFTLAVADFELLTKQENYFCH